MEAHSKPHQAGLHSWDILNQTEIKYLAGILPKMRQQGRSTPRISVSRVRFEPSANRRPFGAASQASRVHVGWSAARFDGVRFPHPISPRCRFKLIQRHDRASIPGSTGITVTAIFDFQFFWFRQTAAVEAQEWQFPRRENARYDHSVIHYLRFDDVVTT
jgi:hypothetical protein